MNELEKQELADLVSKFARKEGVNNTPINGIYCIKTTKIQRIVPRIYDPSLCIIVQGRKQALLAEELYQYEPADYLIVSVDLPMIGRVIEASPEKPYLCMKIELDLQLISELLLEIDVGADKSEGLSTSTNQLDKAESIQSDKTKSRGIFVGKLDETLSESILRLARLMTSADDIPFLSPLMIREVYYRFLKSDYGEAIAQIALNGTTLQRIALVIQQLKADLSSPISVIFPRKNGHPIFQATMFSYFIGDI
ncbi:hypothetical protein TDB9533_04717 [Thalassocella blandensis]|nr:hypothetical protein TDB9533_04717 [Thalassocella blandensis]